MGYFYLNRVRGGGVLCHHETVTLGVGENWWTAFYFRSHPRAGEIKNVRKTNTRVERLENKIALFENKIQRFTKMAVQ